MPKAILIDGNSLAYRAFYALPDTMRTTSGIVTNAIYGFTTMLLKILDQKADFIAIAFDRPEPTFRHKEYKEYKATRDKAPPTLHEQMPYIKELVKAFAIPSFEVAGYEADDVIGTLAIQAAAKGFEVTILTGDMDPSQLINEKIKLLTTRKGLSDTVLYGEKEIEERYGIKPAQVVDFKALKGDSSDNIPGVPKVGEKTAAELLQKFGSLENIFKNLDKIDKKGLRETLSQNSHLAELSKRLATIVTNVPLTIDFNQLQPLVVDWQKVIPIFEKFEFGSLVKKYSQGLEAYQPAAIIDKKRKEFTAFNFKCVKTPDGLMALIKELLSVEAFAFDLETTDLNPRLAKIVGISFSTATKTAYYVPADLHPNLLKSLQPVFNAGSLKIGHNLKYDLAVLNNIGSNVIGPFFDTMVAAYLLDPISNKYALKSLAKQFLGREMLKFTELMDDANKPAGFTDVPLDLASDYACSDAEATFSLYTIFKLALPMQKLDKLFYNVEMPLLEVLIAMENYGVSIDTASLQAMSTQLDIQLKDLERNIFAIAGEVFNLNSPKQLANILFNKLLLPVTKKTKTGPSTDAEVLEDLAGQNFEIAQRLLDYRQLTKLKSTYVDVLPTLIDPRTGRIHTSFNQTITATGRLSSSNPNLQNIPIKGEWGKKLRQAFVPAQKDWLIIAADYSQIELRILAHLSRDPLLLQAFSQGQDIHSATAAKVYGVTEAEVTKEMRSVAKTVNFGIIYGISDFGLAKQLKIKRTQAAQFIQRYFTGYQGVKTFIETTIAQAKKDGFVLTMLGRKRALPDINSPNAGLRAFAERTAVNTVIQGTAADMIKVAMVNTYRKCQISNVKCQMILQVHDELVFEVPKEEVETVTKIVQTEMQNALPLSIPVVVDIGVGNSWSEAG